MSRKMMEDQPVWRAKVTYSYINFNGEVESKVHVTHVGPYLTQAAVRGQVTSNFPTHRYHVANVVYERTIGWLKVIS